MWSYWFNTNTKYKGYNKLIFPNTENFFSSVSMRFAHANVKNKIDIFNKNFKKIDELDLMKDL